MIQRAEATEDPNKRIRIEREAVQAFFAELAHHWTEDLILDWQKNNPVGSQWICEFARVAQQPKCELDPINHELVLNWIHRGYNLLTEGELSDIIQKSTGQRLKPGSLKKRRERLGLTTKRPPGPRPKSE